MGSGLLLAEDASTEETAAPTVGPIGALEVARPARELLKCSATWAEGD